MRRVGSVAIVLMGLWIIAMALALVSSSAWVLNSFLEFNASAAVAVLVFTLGLIAMISLGMWLIRNNGKLAVRLFEDGSPDASVVPLDLLRVGLVLLGVWLLASSAVKFTNAISLWISYGSVVHDAVAVSVGINWWDPAVATLAGLLQLGFGLLLVRKSSLVASRLWEEREVEAVQAEGDMPMCPGCGEPYDPGDYRQDSVALCSHCKTPLDGSA